MFVEPIKGASVLIRAICGSLKTTGAVNAVTPVVIETSQRALNVLQSCSASRWTWVMGGATHQRDVFQQLFLSFDLLFHFLHGVGTQPESTVKEAMQSVFAEVSNVHRTLSDNGTHPWIAKSLDNVVNLQTIWQK